MDRQPIFFIQGDWDVVVIQGQSQGHKNIYNDIK